MVIESQFNDNNRKYLVNSIKTFHIPSFEIKLIVSDSVIKKI